MAKKSGMSVSKIAVWILLGLLILGLGVGFGFDSGLSGANARVARVGDKDVDVNTYARALQNAMNAEAQRRGSGFTMQDARNVGLDQRVLSQLITERALDHEAAEMGVSIGDENLRQQIVAIPAFQGVDGQFDREGYSFALDRAGLSEAQFEDQLRDETARTILQGALLSGVVMPETYAKTLVDYVGETRNFTWARLGQNDLEGDLPDATEADLRAYYDENQDEFTLPETKRITYAVLLPEQLLATIDISEDALREAYDDRLEEFNQPERRLVERLVFLDDASASEAAAQLDADGTTFEALVEGRGLTLEDVDLGDMGRMELGQAGEAIFGADVGDVVGPLPSSLGPALFRINGILPAQSVSFEDAAPDLRTGLAADRARRLIETQAEDFEDILAGGASIEELAAETEMELGQIDWFPANGEGFAAYDEFRDAAAAVSEGDFPSILPLSDGGIFAIRLDEVLPPRPNPFDDARADVEANWEAARSERLLLAKAETLLPGLREGKTFAALELDSTEEEELDRSAFVAGTPPAFMSQVFEMTPGEVRAIESFGTVLLVRLDAINPASENTEAQTLQAQLATQVNQGLARNLFQIFAQDTLLRAGQDVDPRTIAAVQANFP